MTAPSHAPASRRLRRRGIGVALIAVSAAAFGALPIFAKLAYATGADPTAVLFARFALAGACMLAIMLGGSRRFPRGRLLGGLVLLGGVGYVGQSLSFFTAAQLVSAGLVSLLLYVYPAIVAVLAALLLGERMTTVKVAAIVVALAGTALTIGEAGGGRPLGVALGLASALLYAGYIVAGSRVTPHAGALASSTVIILAAAGAYALLALVQRPAFPQSAGGWAAVAGLALVSTVVAIVAFFAGLERVGPADASTLSTLEPLVTVLLAAAVLGESVTGLQSVGGLLILTAVVVLARAGRERLVPEEGPPT